jgi:antitoxin YefM
MKRSGIPASFCDEARVMTIDASYALTHDFSFLKNVMTHPITASKARADLYRLIDQTAQSHQPIVISGKRNSAVLMAADDWQAIQETLYLLSVPGMRKSIRKDMAEPLGKSVKAVRW